MSYEQLNASVSSTSSRSKHFEQLDSSEKADVLAFVEYLKTTDFSTNSINSYKSYVTRAIVKSKTGETLTNDEKSGVRKFLAWLNA